MTARPGVAFLSLFILAGSILLLFLVLLAGTTNSDPLNQIYFLQVDTSNIPNAPSLSRWTFWNICNVNTKGRSVCGPVHPAFPLDPPSCRNFCTTTNIPHQFIGTRQYFYLTRFMFAFVLTAIFFAVCALFAGLLALCSRIGSYFSGFLASIALFFQTIAASLMTAAYVKGRDNFHSNGQSAKLGVKAFAFMWTAFACLFLAMILFCIGGSTNRAPYTAKRSRFGRKRSTRSRGSFIENRRSKNEYS